MKKVVFTLIVIPIFLISSLNFHTRGGDNFHNTQSKFTCTSCHATIINDIIIGKDEAQDMLIDLEFYVPNKPYTNGIIFYTPDKERASYSVPGAQDFLIEKDYRLFELDKLNTGKKETLVKLQHQISPSDIEKGFVEIQGLLSNLDGTPEGDFAFYKKISLKNNFDEINQREIFLFPSIAQQFISIENIPENSSIAIFDLLGKQVYATKSYATKTRVDISAFENGNYFVFINQKEPLRFVVKK